MHEFITQSLLTIIGVYGVITVCTFVPPVHVHCVRVLSITHMYVGAQIPELVSSDYFGPHSYAVNAVNHPPHTGNVNESNAGHASQTRSHLGTQESTLRLQVESWVPVKVHVVRVLRVAARVT